MPNDRPRLLNFDGGDSEFWYWSTDSWTRPGSGVSHTIVICKHTGTISCTCEDAVCRRKTDRIDARGPRVCKHARAVLKWANQLLFALGEPALPCSGA